MSVEYHTKCKYDYIRVLEGEESNPNFDLWFCGMVPPLPVKFKTPKLIVFSSDHIIQYYGFSADVEFTPLSVNVSDFESSRDKEAVVTKSSHSQFYSSFAPTDNTGLEFHLQTTAVISTPSLPLYTLESTTSFLSTPPLLAGTMLNFPKTLSSSLLSATSVLPPSPSVNLIRSLMPDSPNSISASQQSSSSSSLESWAPLLIWPSVVSTLSDFSISGVTSPSKTSKFQTAISKSSSSISASSLSALKPSLPSNHSSSYSSKHVMSSPKTIVASLATNSDIVSFISPSTSTKTPWEDSISTYSVMATPGLASDSPHIITSVDHTEATRDLIDSSEMLTASDAAGAITVQRIAESPSTTLAVSSSAISPTSVVPPSVSDEGVSVLATWPEIQNVLEDMPSKSIAFGSNSNTSAISGEDVNVYSGMNTSISTDSDNSSIKTGNDSNTYNTSSDSSICKNSSDSSTYKNSNSSNNTLTTGSNFNSNVSIDNTNSKSNMDTDNIGIYSSNMSYSNTVPESSTPFTLGQDNRIQENEIIDICSRNTVDISSRDLVIESPGYRDRGAYPPSTRCDLLVRAPPDKVMQEP